MIVLAWLCSEATLLKSFVGVRVAEIQATWKPITWRHVPTKLNPADDLSRGISVNEINGRWMNGPSFLRESPEEWPTEVSEALPEVPELKVHKPVFALRPVTSITSLTHPDSQTGKDYAESKFIVSDSSTTQGLHVACMAHFFRKK